MRVALAICGSTRSCEKTRAASLVPGTGRCLELPIPLIGGVLVAHGQIATAAQRNQIVDRRRAPLRFRDAVSHLEIEDRHYILAPGGRTRGLIGFAHMLEPHLFSQGLRDLRFGIVGGHL